MRIVVIADDLTGAAEVAGTALRFGMSAEVHLGKLYESKADVVVVDSDTRSVPAETAFASVYELTQQAVALSPDVFFKKVDSVLRGPVLAELTAMRIASGLSESLLLCGNPRKHRTVVGGKLFIDGVPLQATDFAIDPEHPCATNDAIDLLVQRSMVISHDAHGTAFDVPKIGDVASAADLDAYAHRWLSQQHTTLAAGGAEFFEAILPRIAGGQPRRERFYEPRRRDELLAAVV